MSYIDDVLQPGETIVGRTRPHWFVYLRAIGMSVLACLLFAGGVAWGPDYGPYVQIAAALSGLLGLWLFFLAWLKRSSTELVVTSRRVIHKTGIFSRQTQEMHLDKVESVDVEQSLGGRLFGYGTVLVRGIGSSWEPFSHIADPLSFRSHITAV